MFGILRKNKGKAYMAISLLILIVISTLAGFCASVTVAHAEDQTVTKREKYGLKVYDYPELAGQEGISKTGYTFDGWYTSATGGTKIDESSWTTPLAENTDLFAHWKPNAYPLKVTYNTDVFNNITVNLKRNDGSNARSYTLGNNGSCTILFDDIVTITANRKGDYTEGNWIYDDGNHRHHRRHYYSFGSWSMQTASSNPVKPSLANAAAWTTSFTLTATGGVTLNVTGSHTTGNVDHQTKHEYVRVRYTNTFGQGTEKEMTCVGDGVEREFNVYAAHWKFTATPTSVRAVGGVPVDHDRTITICYQNANGSWITIDSYTGKAGSLTLSGSIPEDAYWWR